LSFGRGLQGFFVYHGRAELSFFNIYGFAMSLSSCRRLVRFFALSLAIPLLAGCQTDSVTVTEAKKITTSFRGKKFVAPPRSIKDITAILDQQEIIDTERQKKKRAQAEATLPKGKNAAQMARFYYGRGKAAKTLGRTTQAMNDLRKAAEYLEQSDEEANKIKSGKKRRRYVIGDNIRRKLYTTLSYMESGAGFFKNAIRYMELAISTKANPSSYRGLVQIYAEAGNFEKAQEARDRAFEIIERVRGKRGMSNDKRIWHQIHGRRIDQALFAARGQWREAEKVLREAIDIFENKFQDTKSLDFIPREKARLADILRRQGRLTEAEVVGREALLKSLSSLGRNNPTTAVAARRLALIIQDQGRFGDAEKLTRATLDIYAKIGTPADNRKVALSRRFLGTILYSKGDYDGALKEFNTARADLKNNPELLERLFGSNISYAMTLLRTGKSKEALKLLTAGHDETVRRYGKDHFKAAEMGGLKAVALARTGNRKAALDTFRSVSPILIGGTSDDGDDAEANGTDVKRLSAILEGYVSLLADIRGKKMERESGIDAAAVSFRMAEIARARSVQRALAASGARAAAKTPELADLVRSEQDSRKQLGSLFATLADVLSAPTSQQNPAAVKALRDQIGALRSARTAIRGEINKRFPEYADLINPKPASIAEVRRDLKSGEAMIATFAGGKRTFVWAVPKTGKIAFAADDLDREDLADMVGLVRAAVEPEGGTIADIPEFDLQSAHSLYSDLLEPVKAGWKNAKSLLVVAHGPLGWLPFSMLTTEPVKLEKGGPFFSGYRKVPWLARTHAVTVLPSVSSLKTLRGLPPGNADRLPFAGFGDPYFNAQQAADASSGKTSGLTTRGLRTRGAKSIRVSLRAAPKTADLASADLSKLPRLPDTSAEIKSIANALRSNLGTSLFLGARANEQTVKSTDLTKYKVVAFATHGLIPGDLNGLTQPALALSAPGVANVGGDGLLTMEEILGLRLDADWVVLSACNTASGDGAGAEAVSGLGRAFFYAGTRALLVSNWPVESASAKKLTTDLFSRQAKNSAISRAEALRQAMMALVDGPGYKDPDTGKELFVYAHPLFWAPFSLIGDGGAGA